VQEALIAKLDPQVVLSVKKLAFEPVIDKVSIVNAAVPELVSVTELVDDEFALTEPKLSELAENTALGTGTVAVPINSVCATKPDPELLLAVRYASKLPATDEAKDTSTVQLCPGESVELQRLLVK
jgi:hypothetical protein